MTARQRVRLAGRHGFTLIELMVVLLIILVITALTAGAAARIVAMQRRSNSQQTIQKLASALERQWTAVVDNAKDDTMPSGMLTWAGGDQVRARAMWTKLKLRAAFPTNYSEALSAPSVPYLSTSEVPWEPRYASQLNQAGITSGSTPPAPEEAGVCLLMALSIARRGASLDTDILGTASVQSTANPSVKVLVDSWGQGLGFYRFPWGSTLTVKKTLPEMTLADMQPVDPTDPQRRLMDPSWNSSSNSSDITAFENAIGHPIHDPNNATWTPISYAVWPFIVSGGPDKKLGLVPTTVSLPGTMAEDPATPGAANDNIYSSRQQ